MSERKLTIAPEFSLPTDVLTSAIGIIGVRGSGKTTTAGVVVEEAIGAGVPAVIMDPTGAWFGLKSSADGKSPGLPVYVFGGERADVPLEPDSGNVVARFVVDKRVPVVLDVSLMRKNERTKFAADFFEEVYHRNRDPLLVVIDEAAQFVPQTYRGEKNPILSRCLGAVDDIAALGRRRGLGCILIGQRAARINKDVLTQCHTIIAMQLTSPQDRKALNEWVEEQHGSDEHAREFMRALTTLKVGEGFVWSPAMLGLFERVRFRNRWTFDSSATPKIGHKAVTPTVFAEVDLDSLTSEIAAARERAAADDPKVLRRRIAELEKQLAQRPDAEPVVEEVDVPYVPSSLSEHLGKVGEELRTIAKGLDFALDAAAQQCREHEQDNFIAPRRAPPESPNLRTSEARNVAPPETPKQPRGHSRPGSDVALSKSQRLILTALAQFPAGRTKSQVAILSGYAQNGGGFNNSLSALNAKGYILRGDGIKITDAGLDALGPYDPLPTGRELLTYWLGQLSKAEAAALRVLAEAHPSKLSKEEVAKGAGYEATGGGFNNALSRLRTLELIEGRGELRASDALFERAR